MSSAHDGLTRRGWLAGVVGTAAAGIMGGRRTTHAAAPRAKVVRVESPRVWNGDRRDPKAVAEMVNRGVAAFTGDASAADAWKRFFKPGSRVGLKINLLGRPLIYTAHELTDAVAAGIIAAGVKPDDVVVWDRHGDHFAPTSYKPGRGRLGERIEVGDVYDMSRTLQASGGDAPVARVAVAGTDVTVNLPVLKDHGGAGVTVALKNIAFGCYRHHPRAHSGGCDPFIAEACAHFVKHTRVPLIVLDATEACFDDGPQPGSPTSLWRENAIYVASDPVALDVIGREVLNAQRRARSLGDLTRRARHIETAAEMGLGQGDRSQIDLVTLTV